MLRIRLVMIAGILVANCTWAADPDGAALFAKRCATCHDNATDPRIPKRQELAERTPESVVNVMVTGPMLMQSVNLSEEERRAIARFVTAKEFATGVETEQGRCAASGSKVSIKPGDWNGWGMDSSNSRYQPNPGLKAADIPKLKLKWAFGYKNVSSAFGQPTVVGGRVFVGTADGSVYSLDASTGCTYWSFKADASVRTAIRIIPGKNNRNVGYFGDMRASVYALDADTGAQLWRTKVEQDIGRITAGVTFFNGRLYVPVSSLEEASAVAPDYECCKFRGSLVALDAESGKQIWKSYSVLDPSNAYKKSRVGTQMFGPAGAAIWSSPTVDPKRKMIYAATGDSYTDVEINTSDAILAFDMETGSLKWSKQVQPGDNYVAGCPNSPNCPDSKGPDLDFGSSPILRSIGKGKDILIAGQKSGIVWGLDPDKRGEIVWQTRLGAGSFLGGVEWGPAADQEKVYVAIADKAARVNAQPGIYALKIATGEKVWSKPAPQVTCIVPQGCLPAQSAAVSAIPGAVFSGAVNGHFRAYSTANGDILWDYDTWRDFDTVNKVKARGGSIDASGPTIVNGMVYTNSGYAIFAGRPGNVLLAFSVDGK